jgi:hypothetical protein
MKRSTFIAAASGYFLAHAGAREAARLADEVFARAIARVPRQRERARIVEAAGGPGALDESKNIIAQALQLDAEALGSVVALAPDDRALETKVEGLIDQLSGMWLLLTGVLSEQRKGKRVIFTLEPKEESKDQKPKNAKEASRPRSVTADFNRVPVRKVVGPMSIYYYDYIADRATGDDLKSLDRISERPNGEKIAYEVLNLVDGKRSVQAIRDFIAAAYAPVPIEDVADYVRLLERVGVVRFE